MSELTLLPLNTLNKLLPDIDHFLFKINPRLVLVATREHASKLDIKVSQDGVFYISAASSANRWGYAWLLIKKV